MGTIVVHGTAEYEPLVNLDSPEFSQLPSEHAIVRLGGTAAAAANLETMPAAARRERLTAEQEVILAKRIEAGLYAEKVLEICAATTEERRVLRGMYIDAQVREILTARHNRSKDPKLARETRIIAEIETDELIASACNRGEPDERGVVVLHPDLAQDLMFLAETGRKAWKYFWEANQGLAIAMAHRYVNRGLPAEDLVQEAKLALATAIGKFDYRRGTKFSTYATDWIRQAVAREVAKQARPMRMAVATLEGITAMDTVTNELWQCLGREPTIDELANELKTSTEKVIQLKLDAVYPESLNLSVDGNRELIDTLESDADTNAAAEQTLSVENLDRLLGLCLSEEQAAVVRLRFGIGVQAGEVVEFQGISIRFGRRYPEWAADRFHQAMDILGYIAGKPMRNPPKQRKKRERLASLRQEYGPAVRALKEFRS